MFIWPRSLVECCWGMYNIKVNLLSVEVKVAARLIFLFVPFFFFLNLNVIMSLVGVGGEFSLKCTNMFPAELWLRLVLNEHTTTMSQLDLCRNQQVKVKDKLEHDFCCRAVLLVKIKASHFSHIFSATLANRLPFIYLFFKYFIIQLFKIFKASLQMRQRRYLQTVKRAWIMKLQTLEKNVWWALAHFCVLFFISSSSSPFFSNQMHHTGMCAYMYTEQFWNREHCSF